MKLPLLTKQFYSTVGYIEPQTKDRLDILHESDKDILDFDELESESEEEIIDSNNVIFD